MKSGEDQGGGKQGAGAAHSRLLRTESVLRTRWQRFSADLTIFRFKRV
jgi:hypothetical protein